MIKTKKRIAIISLMFCLMASLTLAFGFGNAAKANAEGEESYTLTFHGEPTSLVTTNGWSGIVSPTLSDDGVLNFTFPETGKSVYYSFNTVKGVTYSISFEAQAVGSTGGIGVNLFTSDWNVIKETEWVTETWGTYSYEWTAPADSALFGIQYAWNDPTIQFKSFTIAEKLADVTVTKGSAIGNLPAVPEKAGYAGHWEVDGNAISPETIYDFDSDKNAVPAYEKAYALSFLSEPTNMIKDGWTADNSSIADEVLTLTFSDRTTVVYSPAVSLKTGKTYIIKTDIKSGGNGMGIKLWENGKWSSVFAGGSSADGNALVNADGYIWTTANWATISVEFTPAADVTSMYFNGADTDVLSLQLKNFTITEVVETKIFTKAGAIGELPAVPEKAGYIGHWEMDGETIAAETNFAATENKVVNAVYEKAYTLTFITNETTFDSLTSVANATVNGFVVNYSADWGYVKTNGVTITNGKKYKLEIVAKKTSGEGQLYVLYDAGGSVDGVFHTLDSDYETIIIGFTADKNATGILLQSTETDTVVDFKSVVLTEYETKTLKAGQKAGELPGIPCGINYAGKWYIGENEVTEDTTISQDEIARPVIKYSGHTFKNSEFAFVEAKNTTKPNENTATFGIEYVGTEEVESWSGRNAEDWADGQFTNQKIALSVKKSDGTETTIVSNQMQLNEGVLWFSFTSKVFGDIVEITIPAGEYKLTDGTGFMLEKITFYMVHYNCGVNEKTDYTVEHVAEVKETCTTDGCLDYYYCAKCGRYFEDEDCTAEIKSIEEWKADEEGGLIEKTGHDFKTEWTADATKHWHECTRCDAKEDEAEHDDGNNDKVCDECGISLGSDEPDSSSDSSTDSSSSGSTDNPTDSTSGGGCSSGISAIPVVFVIMLFASACAIFLRKNKESGK